VDTLLKLFSEHIISCFFFKKKKKSGERYTECKSWAFSESETYDFKSTLTKLGLFCKQKLKAKTLHPSSSTVKSSTFTQIFSNGGILTFLAQILFFVDFFQYDLMCRSETNTGFRTRLFHGYKRDFFLIFLNTFRAHLTSFFLNFFHIKYFKNLSNLKQPLIFLKIKIKRIEEFLKSQSIFFYMIKK